jgi:hypothetical protein
MSIKIRILPHARERMQERGATETEVFATLESGERFPARLGRVGFRRNFAFTSIWHGRLYASKQLEVYAVEEDVWIVVTVIVKYF